MKTKQPLRIPACDRYDNGLCHSLPYASDFEYSGKCLYDVCPHFSGWLEVIEP